MDQDVSNEGFKALAAAVVIQATRDARRGDSKAIYWLKTDGLVWCEGLGMDIQPAQIDALLLRRKKRLQTSRPHKSRGVHVVRFDAQPA